MKPNEVNSISYVSNILYCGYKGNALFLDHTIVPRITPFLSMMSPFLRRTLLVCLSDRRHGMANTIPKDTCVDVPPGCLHEMQITSVLYVKTKTIRNSYSRPSTYDASQGYAFSFTECPVSVLHSTYVGWIEERNTSSSYHLTPYREPCMIIP